jgi:hypothetical protein
MSGEIPAYAGRGWRLFGDIGEKCCFEKYPSADYI